MIPLNAKRLNRKLNRLEQQLDKLSPLAVLAQARIIKLAEKLEIRLQSLMIKGARYTTRGGKGTRLIIPKKA